MVTEQELSVFSSITQNSDVVHALFEVEPLIQTRTITEYETFTYKQVNPVINQIRRLLSTDEQPNDQVLRYWGRQLCLSLNMGIYPDLEEQE